MERSLHHYFQSPPPILSFWIWKAKNIYFILLLTTERWWNNFKINLQYKKICEIVTSRVIKSLSKGLLSCLLYSVMLFLFVKLRWYLCYFTIEVGVPTVVLDFPSNLVYCYWGIWRCLVVAGCRNPQICGGRPMGLLDGNWGIWCSCRGFGSMNELGISPPNSKKFPEFWPKHLCICSFCRFGVCSFCRFGVSAERVEK